MVTRLGSSSRSLSINTIPRFRFFTPLTASLTYSLTTSRAANSKPYTRSDIFLSEHCSRPPSVETSSVLFWRGKVK